MSSEPRVDPTANIRDSELGAWTAVGARTSISESTLGDYSYVVSDCNVIYSTIGKFCSIAAASRLNPGNHPLERPALHHFTYRSASYDMGADDDGFFDWRRAHRVVLGNDVWIGHGALVLPGITIGNGAVLGGGAVASKDIPPFAIAVGVPAKIQRYRFEPPIVDRLLRLAWWDWPHDRLAAALPDFRSLPIEAFLEKHETAVFAARVQPPAGASSV
jgi:phosphonate metabolism protein (transferase hexapeptide repeat family)